MDTVRFYFNSLSGYFLGIFLMLHTVLGFVCLFLPENEESAKDVLTYIRIALMFLFNITGFGVLILVSGSMQTVVTFLVSQILMLGIMLVGSILYPEADKSISANMCMLLSVGFIMLTRLNTAKSLKQLLIVTVSFILSMGVPHIIRKFRLLHNFKWIYASIGIGALGLVLITGQITYGANISFTIGGITFQPSELIKIVYVFFIASCFVRARSPREVLISGLIAGVHVLILALSRDLGSALIYGVVYMIMMYVASGNFLYIIAGIIGASLSCVVIYNRFAHVRVRVAAWIDPWSTIDNTGYQITQSLFAISSGSVWGLGLTKGNPRSIPFVEDDFIFSAIVEELGFTCGISILLICLLSFFTFLKLALSLQSMFYRLLAVGLGCAYIFQVFVTVGGGIKFIPLTGVTLPFVSYGGSSVLTSILLFEILAGIGLVAIEEKAFYENIEGTKDAPAEEPGTKA